MGQREPFTNWPGCPTTCLKTNRLTLVIEQRWKDEKHRARIQCIPKKSLLDPLGDVSNFQKQVNDCN